MGQKVRKVLVVEDSPGEMIDNVRLAIEGRVPVHLLGIWGRYTPKAITAIGSGIIFPERIAKKWRHYMPQLLKERIYGVPRLKIDLPFALLRRPFCSGCHYGIILRLICEVIEELGIDQ